MKTKNQRLCTALGMSRQRLNKIRREGVGTKNAAIRLSGALMMEFGEVVPPEQFIFPELAGGEHWFFQNA